MAAVYRVDIEDHSGNVIHVFKTFTALTATIRIGGKGDYQLTLSRHDSNVEKIQDDYLIRIWRIDETNDVPWVNVFTGIHKTFNRSLQQNGRKGFTSYGPDSSEILDKAYVLYPAYTPFTTKSAAAETVMKEFVRENVTSIATVANGRDTDHVNPVNVSGDAAAGPIWTDRWVRQNLLAVLQNIRQYSINQGDQIDFEMKYTGGYQWRFDAGKIFTDRTNVGLNATTGRNGANNIPIIFSPLVNNVFNFNHSKSRYNEINTVVALGRQIGSLRQTYVAQEPSLGLVSPISQREGVANAQNNSSAQLEATATAALEEGKSRAKFNLEPRLTDIQLWKDFFPGDFVTLLTDTNESFQRQVTEVRISIGQNSEETIDLKFSDEIGI